MKPRNSFGMHSAELVGGLMVLIPVVLYGIDYSVMMYGGQMNASCCSAACRAAAQGPPTGYASDPTNTPQQRAKATLAKMVQPQAVVRMSSNVRSFESVDSPAPTAPYGGAFLGYVTLKTRCDVFPPFLLPFIPKQATLYTQQTYPWTYVMPATFMGNQPTSGKGGQVQPLISVPVTSGNPNPPQDLDQNITF